MDIVFITKRATRSRVIRVNWFIQLISVVFIVSIFSASSFLAGTLFSENKVEEKQVASINSTEVDELKKTLAELTVKSEQLEMDKLVAQADVELLTRRIGQMQAHVIRLNALGDRLTEIADIDRAEFSFDKLPPQGGEYESSSINKKDNNEFNVELFVQQLDHLEQQLQDRGIELDYMESFLLSEKMDKNIIPSGRPIKKGWVSSYFGKRKDPFTGKSAFHSGIDMASKEGVKIFSAADGIVTWSGKRWAYGQMVEIDHGNGYTTRYGHNNKLLVNVGDKVKKGQLIATMGSSGRSTGPHVHFEVRKNGKAQNPLKYIKRKG